MRQEEIAAILYEADGFERESDGIEGPRWSWYGLGVSGQDNSEQKEDLSSGKGGENNGSGYAGVELLEEGLLLDTYSEEDTKQAPDILAVLLGDLVGPCGEPSRTTIWVKKEQD